MNKHIVIIGAGVSGLSLLHFLKTKYAGRRDVKITLIEQGPRAGGNIHTIQDNGCLFEAGPNAFQTNQPATLELIEQLGLSSELISANAAFKKRFILINQQLHAFPLNPFSIFKFKPLTFREQLRFLAELFVPKGNKEDESVYNFAKRRAGVKAACYFFDAMMSGIYAGDSRFLGVKSALPRLYDLEQKHGSIIRAMLFSGGKIKSELKSFRRGMGQLITALAERGNEHIRYNEPVRDIITAKQYYIVITDQDKYSADELFVCTPAYAAADLLGKLHKDLGMALQSIDYAPLTVVGLVFDKAALKTIPEGFGYLVPSTEENPVLGVLIENNVFEGRASESQVLLRVMIGGSRHPDYVRKTEEELLNIALKEIDARYGVKTSPVAHFFASYSKAIPQYETGYPTLMKRVAAGLATLPKLHLLANYLNGVAVNDCIRNAKETAARVEI